MGQIAFNIGLGRIHELAIRVNGNDPTNAAFVVMLLAATGIDTDAVMRDRATVDALVGAGTACNEATNTNYARKILAESTLTITVDTSGDQVLIDCDAQTWLSVAADGTGAISDLVFAYDSDTTGGNDTNIVPLTLHDFAVTPDGSNLTAQIATGGFAKAAPGAGS